MATEKKRKAAARKDIGISLESLEAKAAESDLKEAYWLVSDGADHRLGIVATAGKDGARTFSVELLVCALEGAAELELSTLEKAVNTAEKLKSRGYSLTQQDDGWITCEKQLPRNDVARECEGLMILAATSKARRFVSIKKEASKRGRE